VKIRLPCLVRGARWSVAVGLLGLLAACTNSHLVTLTIVETPSRYVRLAVDRTVSLDSGFSHPASLPPETMAAILSGLVVVEKGPRLPWPLGEGRAPRPSAFDREDIRFWAPVLAQALEKATPEEIVTFYQSDTVSATRRDVTSGGVFVKDRLLYIMLSNYRSPSEFMADIGTADTMDDRRYPLKSIGPHRFTLQFEPESAVEASWKDSLLARWPYRGKALAVRLDQLPPSPSQTLSDH
jgi:hypothetical protein